MFPIRVAEGSSAKVLCNVVHGKRPVEFKWLINAHPLEETLDKKIAIQDDFSMLTLSNIKATDAGNYTCIAKNTVGKTKHSANLVVEGKSQNILIL